MSPLAEGRELKYKWEEQERPTQGESPLAEGRELKYEPAAATRGGTPSPLAEGRELKFRISGGRAQSESVAPRGGA